MDCPGKKSFLAPGYLSERGAKADGDERWVGTAPMSSQSLLFPGGGVGLPSGSLD